MSSIILHIFWVYLKVKAINNEKIKTESGERKKKKYIKALKKKAKTFQSQ